MLDFVVEHIYPFCSFLQFISVSVFNGSSSRGIWDARLNACARCCALHAPLNYSFYIPVGKWCALLLLVSSSMQDIDLCWHSLMLLQGLDAEAKAAADTSAALLVSHPLACMLPRSSYFIGCLFYMNNFIPEQFHSCLVPLSLLHFTCRLSFIAFTCCLSFRVHAFDA